LNPVRKIPQLSIFCTFWEASGPYGPGATGIFWGLTHATVSSPAGAILPLNYNLMLNGILVLSEKNLEK